MTHTRTHDAGRGGRAARASAPVSPSAAITRRAPRGRRLRLALGGALLLAIAGGFGLRHRQAAAPAPGAPAPPPEDAAEARRWQAAAARPGDASAWIDLGRYEEANAHPFEAMWADAEAQRLQPAASDLPTSLASALQAGQILDLAAARWVGVTHARPADLPARCRLAELCLSIAEPGRARSVLTARRSAVWQDADAVTLLGRAEQGCGDMTGAIAAFKRSLSLQPRQAEAWYRLGRSYLVLNRAADARDALFHALAADPSRADTSLYAGMTYLGKPGPGDLDRAVRFFKGALALRPADSAAQYQCGLALARQGKQQEALGRYEQAVLADLNDADPNQALGRALIAAGNREDGCRYLGRYNDLEDRPAAAIHEFAAMQTAAPQSIQPVLLEGQIYMRRQQDSRAVAITEAALKRHPEDTQLLERLAVLKINRGDRPYARRLLSRWLQLAPRAADPLWLLGRCDFGDMNYAAGIAWEEKALRRHPRNPHYLAFLGGGCLKLGSPASLARGVTVLAQAVALLPDNADYRELYAQGLQQLGRYDEARRQYLQALDTDPFRISCYTPVAQLGWRLNRPGAATFFASATRAVQQRLSEESLLWLRVWQHSEDAQAHLKLARFLCRTADLTKARYQLQQVIELRPDLQEARRLLTTVQRVQEVL